MTVTCPACGKRYRAEEQSSGQRLTCRVCGGAIDVPVFNTRLPFTAGAPMPVRELEYSQAEDDQYVELPGEERIDRVLPWVMMAGFVLFVFLAARNSVNTVLARSPSAGAYAAGVAFGQAIVLIVLLAGVAAPLCVLGIFIASRIMKFTNRPMLYWRSLAVMATPFVGLLVLSGFAPHRALKGPIAWTALLPMFGVLWLLTRLKIGPFSVAAAFVTLCGVGGPILLLVLVALPVLLISGSRRSIASLAPPTTTPARTAVTRGTPLTAGQMRILRPLVEKQLKTVGAALQAYSAAHGGRYPRTLMDLETAGLLQASDRRPVGGTGSWFYSTRGLMAPLPAEFVLAYDGAGADRRRTCLFGDGHVETLDLADWPRVIGASGDSIRRGVRER